MDNVLIITVSRPRIGKSILSKLDKAEVLAALYNASRQQGLGVLHERGASGMSVDEAEKEVVTASVPMGDGRVKVYFDYLHGRVMKVDIGGDELGTCLFDRDNGDGAAAAALKPLLEKVS